MLKETVIVGNQTGIHARPAGVLAKTVGQFQSRIELVYNGKTIKAKSIMGILGAGIKGRAQVEIICEGQDEERAMQELKQLFARGFGFD
ncbi:MULTISPECIES: HPr family phosphocarrier protein [Hafnia]|jgi:phosphocarrier protein HPr|uniref:Phosphocarrier protein NPr n=1 Tax=Hafnia paralvei TaxID=546367 RepID=A0A2A2MG27_9GAMM|nr:HPr family phosphocarrier protein [Hafnia paralvei]KHS46426.1 PTS sugar transporter [Hafnia paralvei]MBU2674481.1 HPr family phosphocarrier protein [Hafnia paralvei]MBW2958788.1 HPr family phosphocarrier protein [Hafnia paralvei]MCE9881140.1 HPr family phosphocarrier protein [Hafnia paralvei]MCE9903393.1 HPr family phosphocarrier protein [Hafnia paralvei]